MVESIEEDPKKKNENKIEKENENLIKGEKSQHTAKGENSSNYN